MDKSMNEKVYGSSVDAREILSGRMTANRSVQPFMDALEKVVPKKRISQR
jgi:lipid-binding SYLF domain-containing protein